MKYIKSTYEILAWKVFDIGVDERWVDWAIDMVLSGFESEHLLILAGELKPYNQFYFRELTTKLFKELELDLTNQDKIINNYIIYLVEEAYKGRKNTYTVLDTITRFYYDLDCPSSLTDLALLYWAWGDLKYDEVQWYWPGADRTNINFIIQEYFKDWLAANEYR
jgi:hypothetical protein